MINDLLTKKPFVQISPDNYHDGTVYSFGTNVPYYNRRNRFKVLSQADFLQELNPSGHVINNKEVHPDRVSFDFDEDGNRRFFRQKVFRIAAPLQEVILTQQVEHLTGNDIQHEIVGNSGSDSDNEILQTFRSQWYTHNMEEKMFGFFASDLSTGDSAIVFHLRGGKLFAKNLSFLSGDTLYPHYDDVTGELSVFARQFYDYDLDGNEVISWVEVWDDEFKYTYRQDRKGIKGAINTIKELFGLEGYELVSQDRHNFREIPVVYKRSDGPCWGKVQKLIENYELAISTLAKNNAAYAYPILLLKGEDVTIQGDMYGAVKAISMGADDDASYLEQGGNSENFKLLLETLLKQIFLGSYSVLPPEVKSGDLPGVTVKLIYAPSLEAAQKRAREYNESLQKIVSLFKYGLGVELGRVTEFNKTEIYSWIKPYVFTDESSEVNNVIQLIGAGAVSKRSGSELAERLGYAMNGEWDRLVSERKNEEEEDILIQNATATQTANNFEE